MTLLKINLLLIITILFFSCSELNKKKFPYTIKSDFDIKSNIVIYLISPLDCENCKGIDRSYIKDLTNCKKIPKKNMVFIMPKKRPIEIPVLLKDIMGENWKSFESNVFSSDSLKDEIMKINNLTDFSSYIMIYTPSGDSILYKSYIHDMDIDEVLNKYL